MSCSTKPTRRIDVSPQITKWRAEKARREGQRSRDRRPGPRYRWPDDRPVIIAATLAAVRPDNGKAEPLRMRSAAEKVIV